MRNNNNTPPPWSEAPPWAKYRAQDKIGLWLWYEIQPSAGYVGWNFGGLSKIDYTKEKLIENPNWRDTMQKRPENE